MSENGKSVSGGIFDQEESSCSDPSCCPPKNPIVRATPKIGRNDPCICGNGKKYKKCCGKNV